MNHQHFFCIRCEQTSEQLKSFKPSYPGIHKASITATLLKQREGFSVKAHRPVVNTDAEDKSTGGAEQHPSTDPPDALEEEDYYSHSDRAGRIINCLLF